VNKHAKPYRGFVFIERFKQVAHAINSGREKSADFIGYGFICPTLREITKNYVHGLMTKEEALGKIKAAEKKARNYLVSRGYDPSRAEEKENNILEEKVISKNAACKKLKQML